MGDVVARPDLAVPRPQCSQRFLADQKWQEGIILTYAPSAFGHVVTNDHPSGALMLHEGVT